MPDHARWFATSAEEVSENYHLLSKERTSRSFFHSPRSRVTTNISRRREGRGRGRKMDGTKQRQAQVSSQDLRGTKAVALLLCARNREGG